MGKLEEAICYGLRDANAANRSYIQQGFPQGPAAVYVADALLACIRKSGPSSDEYNQDCAALTKILLAYEMYEAPDTRYTEEDIRLQLGVFLSGELILATIREKAKTYSPESEENQGNILYHVRQGLATRDAE
jgi:hypothetical protein